ncbi:hypothetical protein AAC387_Pa03g1920 [Persea americana]
MPNNLGILAWELADKITRVGMEIVFTVAWRIWNRRNYFIYNRKFIDPKVVVADALALVQDFKRIWVSKNSLQKEKALHRHSPPLGVVKRNVDGATIKDVQKAGVGAILRDEKCNVIMALSRIEDGVAEADDIGAVAALRGLQMDCSIGVHDIILEGDSLWMIDALNSSSPNLSRQCLLFNDIKILWQHFKSYEVTHVGREGNAIAHTWARYAQFIDDIEVWWFSVPNLIMQNVIGDSMCCSY